MTTRPTRITALVAGGVVLTIVHFVFYDPVDKSPTFLRPGLLIYDGVVLFLAINLFAFAVNIFKSLTSLRGSKDEQHIQEVLEPAFQGRISDQRLLHYTDIPFFASLGAIIAGVLVWIFR